MVATAFERSVERFLPQFVVSLYGWGYAVYFGLVALDSVYANQLNAALEPALRDGIFSEISDFLLTCLALLVLAGGAACGAARKHPRALIALLFSGFLLIALLALQPLLVAWLDGTGYGAVLRVLAILSGSLLAMIGVSRFRRSRKAP
jgi:hypothetical protein